MRTLREHWDIVAARFPDETERLHVLSGHGLFLAGAAAMIDIVKDGAANQADALLLISKLKEEVLLAADQLEKDFSSAGLVVDKATDAP